MEQPQTSGGQDTNRSAGIMGRVRNSANAQLTQQKDRATDGLGSVAQAVRQSTQQLRSQQHDTIAQYVEQAADQLEKLSTRLKEKNVSELMDDAQRFARQRPALFIGSAFAIGLIGSRFFKSSADRRGVTSDYAYDTSRTVYSPGTDVRGTGYVGADIPATGYGGTEIR
jgi:ElaB/YqjD/DUF883 family membrane-anchored ribosome-binding protein